MFYFQTNEFGTDSWPELFKTEVVSLLDEFWSKAPDRKNYPPSCENNRWMMTFLENLQKLVPPGQTDPSQKRHPIRWSPSTKLLLIVFAHFHLHMLKWRWVAFHGDTPPYNFLWKDRFSCHPYAILMHRHAWFLPQHGSLGNFPIRRKQLRCFGHCWTIPLVLRVCVGGIIHLKIVVVVGEFRSIDISNRIRWNDALTIISSNAKKENINIREEARGNLVVWKFAVVLV